MSLATWIVLDLVKYPLGIDAFVFTSYLETPWDVFSSRCDGLDATWFPSTLYCLLSSFFVIITTTALGIALFCRRNLGTC